MSNHDAAVVPVIWRGANDTIGRLAAIAKLEALRPLSIVIENGSGDASAATLREASDLDILIESRTSTRPSVCSHRVSSGISMAAFVFKGTHYRVSRKGL